MSLPLQLAYLLKSPRRPAGEGEGRHVAIDGLDRTITRQASRRRGGHRLDRRCRVTAVIVNIGPVQYEGHYWRRWLP